MPCEAALLWADHAAATLRDEPERHVHPCSFLVAMLRDDGPLKPVGVHRCLKNADSGRTYKARRTRAGAIRETALGKLAFADSTLRARVIEVSVEQRLIEEHHSDQLSRRGE